MRQGRRNRSASDGRARLKVLSLLALFLLTSVLRVERKQRVRKEGTQRTDGSLHLSLRRNAEDKEHGDTEGILGLL